MCFQLNTFWCGMVLQSCTNKKAGYDLFIIPGNCPLKIFNSLVPFLYLESADQQTKSGQPPVVHHQKLFEPEIFSIIVSLSFIVAWFISLLFVLIFLVLSSIHLTGLWLLVDLRISSGILSMYLVHIRRVACLVMA